MKTINQINGIPLHYARLTNHPYGTKGEQRNFSIENNFLKVVEAALEEVFANCPLGKPDIITTAGTLVNKPGQHGSGKAFDIDAIFWDSMSLITLDFYNTKELYIGIESFLRKHFGIVLNHFYPNHADHWHVDTSVSVDYNENSKSETLYLQMALKYIYGKDILVDGIWGNQTKGAVTEVFNRLNISTPITTKSNYLKFLDITGKVAFKLYENEDSPLKLLENLNEIVEQLPSDNKTKVQQALNTFVDHKKTSKWLKSFDESHGNLEDIIDDII